MRLLSFALATCVLVMATFSTLALAGGFSHVKDLYDVLATSHPRFLLTGEHSDESTGSGGGSLSGDVDVEALSTVASLISTSSPASSSVSSPSSIASLARAVLEETKPTLSPTIAKWQAMSALARQGATAMVKRDQPPPTPQELPQTSATARAAVDPASTLNMQGEWVEVTWSVPSSKVLPTDRIALLWKPRCESNKIVPSGFGGGGIGGGLVGSNDNGNSNNNNTAAAVDAAYSTEGCGALYDRSPIAYAFVKRAAPQTWKTQGTGSFKFWIPKPQQYDLRASYVRASTEKLIWRYWIEVAGADVVARTPNDPTPPRLSYVGGGSGGGAPLPPTVQVTWTTRDVVAGSSVQYGTSPQALTSSVAPTTDSTYYQSLFCAAPALYLPSSASPIPALRPTSEGGSFLTGVINNAVLSNLAPDTTYYYRVVVPGSTQQPPPTGSFRTAPAPLPASQPSTTTRMLLAGDGGQARPDGAYQTNGNIFPLLGLRIPLAGTVGTSRYTLVELGLNAFGEQTSQQGAETVFLALEAELSSAAASGQPYHGLMFNGDLSYARGEQMQWTQWFAQAATIFGNVPILYTSGNHESSTSPNLAEAAFPGVDDGGECGQAYTRQLLMPTPSGEQFFWYSTVKGSAFFIQLNSDQSVLPGSTQRAWLLSTLAAVDRSKTPWLIVALHRPLYSDFAYQQEVERSWNLTMALEPIFFENSVDLVLTAHIHNWQRTCPAAKGGCFTAQTPQQQAPVNVAFPSAGFKSSLGLYKTRPAYIANEGYGYGYSRLSYNATSLTYETLEVPPPPAPALASVVDAVTLSKPLGWQPASKEAQAAVYASIPPTPEPTRPYNDSNTVVIEYVLKCLLLPEPVVDGLVDKYVAPGSEVYRGVYDQMYEWTPNQQWATTVAYLDVLRAMGPGFTFSEFYKYTRNLVSPGGRCYFPEPGSGYGGIN